MIEVYLPVRILSFDGRIIESFGSGQPSFSYHIAWVTRAEIQIDNKGRQFIIIETKGGVQLTSEEVPPEAQSAAAEFISAVQKAMRVPI